MVSIVNSKQFRQTHLKSVEPERVNIGLDHVARVSCSVLGRRQPKERTDGHDGVSVVWALAVGRSIEFSRDRNAD